MKYISSLFILALLLFGGASLHAQSLQSKCGSLSGSALQICIAQWQADQARGLQRDQQLDNMLQDSIRQGQVDQAERLRRMQQDNDVQLQKFRYGCGGPGALPC